MGNIIGLLVWLHISMYDMWYDCAIHFSCSSPYVIRILWDPSGKELRRCMEIEGHGQRGSCGTRSDQMARHPGPCNTSVCGSPRTSLLSLPRCSGPCSLLQTFPQRCQHAGANAWFSPSPRSTSSSWRSPIPTRRSTICSKLARYSRLMSAIPFYC